MTTIYTFASNLAGRHGAGSALEAVKRHGAIRGIGHGRQGDSYAIPTKDAHLQTLPLEAIRYFVNVFLQHARQHPSDTFKVVAIGCGLAGYSPSDIAPMFDYCPINVQLPQEFIY